MGYVLTNHSVRLRKLEDHDNYIDQVIGQSIEHVEKVEEKLGIIRPLPSNNTRRPF